MKQQSTQTTETVVMHLVSADDFRDDGTVRTVCGKTLTFDPNTTAKATQTGDYVICPLCELADELGED